MVRKFQMFLGTFKGSHGGWGVSNIPNRGLI